MSSGRGRPCFVARIWSLPRLKTLALWIALLVAVSEPAFGLQREIRSRIVSYDNAPARVREASVQLIQTYGTPSQFPLATLPEGSEAKIIRSRVRYLNRANQQVPTYQLDGECALESRACKDIAAIQVTAIFLLLFVGQILLYSFHEFTEAGVFPHSEVLHIATEPFSPQGLYGKWISLGMVFICACWLAGAWVAEKFSPRNSKQIQV